MHDSAQFSTSSMPQLFEELVELGPSVAEEVEMPRGWCLTAAGVARKVLLDAGIPGIRVVGVDVEVANAAAVQWLAGGARGHMPEEGLLGSLLGSGQSLPDGWDGHAVAYVPARATGDTAWVIDLSASQFSNEDCGVRIPNLAFRVNHGFLAGEPHVHHLPTAGLKLSRNPHLCTAAQAQIAAAQPSIDAIACVISGRLGLAPAT